jgi:hypothetical protein
MTKFLFALFLELAVLAHAKTLYQCPMHPQIIREQPGTCPICHMTLEPVDDGSLPSPAGRRAGGAGQRAHFSLSTERQQLIGVKTVTASAGTLTKRLRLSARVGGGAVLAQLMEMDAGLVKAGQVATLVGPGGQRLKGRVTAVESGLDALTRSFGVLIAPGQASPWLRNGVYCEAQVEVPLGRGLRLPADAVLQTGEQAVLFVREHGEHFEPRQVELGQQDEDWVEVTKGLKAGEEVVTGAAFLIDSEARARGAVETYQAEGKHP